MKKIMLIRHGKARKENGDSDYARLLSGSGRTNMEILAKNLKNEKNSELGLILSSPAIRAFESSVILAEEFGILRDEILINENFYSGDTDSALHALKTLSDKYSAVCIVGHNPLLENLLSFLTVDIPFRLSVSSAVLIEFDVKSFSEIEKESGKFIFYKFINDDPSKFEKNIIKTLRDESSEMLDSLFSESKTISTSDFTVTADKIAKKIFNASSAVTVRNLDIIKSALFKTEEKNRDKENSEREKILKKLAKIEAKMSMKLDKLEKRRNKIQNMLEDREIIEPSDRCGKHQ